jgi:bifunctional non-homologous end joining protein LigD
MLGLVRETALSSIELMHPMDHPPFSGELWIFEFKYDGYRVLANKGQLLTRQKKNVTTWFPETVEALQELRGSFVIDGEICLHDERGVPQFERMRGRARRKGGDLVTLCVFDLLFQNGEDLRELAVLKRKERLRKLIPRDHPQLKYIDHLADKGVEMFKFATAMGMEGVVGKRSDSPYVAGRSRLWLRSKQPGFHDGWERPLTRPPAK